MRIRLRSLLFLELSVDFGWILSLMAKPGHADWESRKLATVTLKLPKVSGFKVSPKEAQTLAELSAFVNARVPPYQPLFVGLHRHDVVIIGDIMSYFILNRPNATRYHELHPAITDTAGVQHEIISHIQGKNIPVIILKRIFSDEHLERVKKGFLKNLPHIGATDLDQFIREHYVEARRFGRYVVWQGKDLMPSSARFSNEIRLRM